MSSSNGDTLMAVGHQCSAEFCRLVDFLPFKCQHCEQKFCGEHFVPAAHKCSKYDESKHNRIAPSCPLCNTPVAIPPGQDPNIRMEQHITNECSVMTGKTKSSSQPHCANPRCKKVLYAPIRCDNCKQQFCAQHRFPGDHACVTLANSSTKGSTSVSSVHQASTSARSAAAMAAIKRSMASKSSNLQPPRAAVQSTKPSTSTTPSQASNSQPSRSTSSSGSTSNSSTHNPFSKTDRRARAERESRLRAMEEREKKGLLSEGEKAILAAERANDKDGCVLM